MSAAEDFAQYKLHFVDDIQHDYEVIRPIVLFAGHCQVVDLAS